MKKCWHVILFVLFVLIGCASFPIYNFSKSYTYPLTGTSLLLNLVCYIELGVFEKKILHNQKFWLIALVNPGVILLGMLCRFLLEFGEVSNVYNFTLPNIALHVFVTYGISVLSYLFTKSQD